jgi:filamentous hemagglutinin family protein
MFSRYIDNFDFKSRFRILKGGKISLVVSALLGSVIVASAAPTGGVVTSGNATINQSGNTTDINQTTQKASINWQNFNVNSNETVNFNQPNTNSITLNRVIGNEKSVIDGTLNANGQVWILNSNGILFNSTAKVNTSGLVATTAELSDKDFQDGNYNFKNSKSNSVVNLGTIDVSNNGYVVLASNEVRNSGTIKAIKGKVFLSGNSEYTINLNGNSIVNLIVTKGVLDALAQNSGTIIANGGEIYLTTNAVNELLKGVVNNTGVIEANSLDDVTGKVEVYAHGGTANVSGSINAEGGFVETSGDKVKIADDTKIKSKNWLIDPTDFTVAASGGDLTGAQVSDYLNNSGDMQIITSSGTTGTNGDIFINDIISWSTNKYLELNAYRNIYINSDITSTNASGKVKLYYGQGGVASGNTSDYYIASGKSVNLKAGQNFFTKLGLDGTVKNYQVITSLGSAGSTTGTDLQGINGNLSGNYVLGSDIDASSTSSWNSGAGFQQLYTVSLQSDPMDPFMPPMEIQTNFSGNFDGLGHSVSNLIINRPSDNKSVGLFSTITGATIQNLGLINVNFKGNSLAGGITGTAQNSTISNSYVTGIISTNTNTVGGIVGDFSNSKILNSYSSANVSGGSCVGGLVGNLSNSSSITNSYATGEVFGNSSGWAIGGLVGNQGGNIINSYSIGKVYGTGTLGGLVGRYFSGNTTNSFWNTETSLQSSSAGGTGKTTVQMKTLSTYTNASWDITGIDGTYPILTLGKGTNSSHVWEMISPYTTLTYTLSDISSGYTYNGNLVSLSSLWNSSTIFGSNYGSLIAGTDYVFKDSNGTTITSYTNAGTYSGLYVSLLSTSNTASYLLSSSGNTNGSLVVNKAHLTVTADNVSKTYGNSNPTLTTSISGYVNGETLGTSGVTGSATATTTATTSTGVGSATIIVGVGTLTASNYDFTNLINGTLTVTPRAITVTADAVSKTYGDVNPNLTYAVTSGSLVNSDTLSGSLATSATQYSNVGDYDVTSTLANSNYNVAFVGTNKLGINQRAITLNATDLSKVYGENDPTLAYTVTSGTVVNGDSLGLNLVRATGEDVNTTTGYEISNNGTLNSNYNVTFNNGKLNITEKPTTAQVSLKTSETTGVPLKLDGILSSEQISQGTKIVVLDSTNKDVTELAKEGKIQPGKYSVKAINENINYALTSNSVELTINPALDPITLIKPQVSVPVIPVTTIAPIVVNTPASQKVEINNNLAVKLGITDSGNVNLVSQTTVGQANQVITLSELKTSTQDSNTTEKKEIKLEDVRVSLNQNSIVQIVNGGVTLPDGVDQQFYVVKQNINTSNMNTQNNESKENKKAKGTN